LPEPVERRVLPQCSCRGPAAPLPVAVAMCHLPHKHHCQNEHDSWPQRLHTLSRISMVCGMRGLSLTVSKSSIIHACFHSAVNIELGEIVGLKGERLSPFSVNVCEYVVCIGLSMLCV
jgi:hypothetical protein